MALQRLLTALFLVSSTLQTAIASDPNILSDFVAPANGIADGNYFTYTGTRSLATNTIAPLTNFTVTKVGMAEFPALNGQSVSYAALYYPPASVNPPHAHPRASELLFVVSGSIQVGFVDTNNKLYTQTLQVGDMFVFPKGLVHFQYNPATDPEGFSVALSSFGSANPGTVSIPTSLFSTGVDDTILANSFRTDVSTIQKIKAGLTPRP